MFNMILWFVILILGNTFKRQLHEFNKKELEILSGYLKSRMLEPIQIELNDLMCYFSEYLEFKGINNSFTF